MICHDLHLIFIHIPRTAGTSFELAMTGQNWWNVDSKSKHLTYKQAKLRYADYWDSYFKVSIVRNPWDWLVSLYFSHSLVRSNHGRISWKDYLKQPRLVSHEQDTLLQSEIVGNELDVIMRYESLQKDFDNLCNELGIQKELPYFHAKSGRIEKRRHYSQYYDDDLRDIVSKNFEVDIDRFGYSFEHE